MELGAGASSETYLAVKREHIPFVKGNWRGEYARAHDADCGNECKNNVKLHRDNVSAVTGFHSALRLRCGEGRRAHKNPKASKS